MHACRTRRHVDTYPVTAPNPLRTDRLLTNVGNATTTNSVIPIMHVYIPSIKPWRVRILSKSFEVLLLYQRNLWDSPSKMRVNRSYHLPEGWTILDKRSDLRQTIHLTTNQTSNSTSSNSLARLHCTAYRVWCIVPTNVLSCQPGNPIEEFLKTRKHAFTWARPTMFCRCSNNNGVRSLTLACIIARQGTSFTSNMYERLISNESQFING